MATLKRWNDTTQQWELLQLTGGDIGDLNTLTTTEKGSVVGAINEVDSSINLVQSVSGSSASGSWIKHSDGTMECFAELTATYSQANRLEVNWTFPQAFVGDLPVVFVNRSSALDTIPIDTRYIPAGRATNLTTANIRLLDPSNGWVAGNVRQVYVRAIGRWK